SGVATDATAPSRSGCVVPTGRAIPTGADSARLCVTVWSSATVSVPVRTALTTVAGFDGLVLALADTPSERAVEVSPAVAREVSSVVATAGSAGEKMAAQLCGGVTSNPNNRLSAQSAATTQTADTTITPMIGFRLTKPIDDAANDRIAFGRRSSGGADSASVANNSRASRDVSRCARDSCTTGSPGSFMIPRRRRTTGRSGDWAPAMRGL